MKNIQIPEQLFLALVQYHLIGMDEALLEIEKGLMDKIDTLAMRQLYIQYKTAPTEEEQQKARKEYLDKRGIGEDFRW